MVRCEYCGSIVNEENGNCPNCGAPLPEEEEVEKLYIYTFQGEEVYFSPRRNERGQYERKSLEERSPTIESLRDAEKTIEAETIKCKILMFAFIGVLVAANLAWILSMFF